MKASELITRIEELKKRHGDIDVYYSYDGGILINCHDVDYYKNVEDSPYYREPTIIPKAIIINYDTE